MSRTRMVEEGETLGETVATKLKVPIESVFLKGKPNPKSAPLDYGVARPVGFNQIIQTFGDIRKHVAADGTLRASWESAHMGQVLLPFAIPLAWAPDKQVRRLYCHTKLKGVFKAVFEEIVKEGLRGKVVSYGGCFNFRLKRGGQELSAHSWGIAVDLNVKTNQPGTRSDMNPHLVKIFKRHGFIWGGDWSGCKDPMHFQFCDGY